MVSPYCFVWCPTNTPKTVVFLQVPYSGPSCKPKNFHHLLLFSPMAILGYDTDIGLGFFEHPQWGECWIVGYWLWRGRCHARGVFPHHNEFIPPFLTGQEGVTAWSARWGGGERRSHLGFWSFSWSFVAFIFWNQTKNIETLSLLLLLHSWDFICSTQGQRSGLFCFWVLMFGCNQEF